MTKLYSVDRYANDPRLVEWEVIKDTAKQVITRRIGASFSYEQRMRKDGKRGYASSNYDVLFETPAGAIEHAIWVADNKAEDARNKATRAEAEAIVLRQMLLERQS